MANMAEEGASGVVILAPVYNDWQAAGLLLQRLDEQRSLSGIRARVVFVDDGSIDPFPESWNAGKLRSVSDVNVLTLRRNVGHQRAIAIGLAYVDRNVPCDVVVVM